MGVLGKDLLDFHRPRTNTKVEFGASGYWVESHPTMQPYGAVLTEILNLDAAPFQELLDQYRKAVAEKDAEHCLSAIIPPPGGMETHFRIPIIPACFLSKSMAKRPANFKCTAGPARWKESLLYS